MPPLPTLPTLSSSSGTHGVVCSDHRASPARDSRGFGLRRVFTLFTLTHPQQHGADRAVLLSLQHTDRRLTRSTPDAPRTLLPIKGYSAQPQGLKLKSPKTGDHPGPPWVFNQRNRHRGSRGVFRWALPKHSATTSSPRPRDCSRIISGGQPLRKTEARRSTLSWFGHLQDQFRRVEGEGCTRPSDRQEGRVGETEDHGSL